MYRCTQLSFVAVAALTVLFALETTAGAVDESADNASPNVAAGVTCDTDNKNKKLARVVRISDLRALGRSAAIEHCIVAVRSAREGVACALSKEGRDEYLIRKVSDLNAIRQDDMTLRECTQATSTAKEGLVCARSGKAFSKFRISDRREITSGLTLEQCISF